MEEDFVPAPSLLLPLLGGQQEAGGEPGGEEAVGEGETDVREMEMAKTERMILKAVDFHLRTCTAATFLHYFNQV